MFNDTNPNAIISKSKKKLINSVLHFRILHKIWNTLKKKWASEVICFWNYRLKNAGFLQCRKSCVSEYLWTVKKSKGPKHGINLQDSTFVILFDFSERKSARKNVFSQYLKCWDCLLTYYHPMASILSQ